MVAYKNEWYFWHEHYPNYEERMQVMSQYVASFFSRYAVDTLLTLVPKY